MLSLEMARKLKSAGLEWEPQIGDMLYWNSGIDGWTIDALNQCDIAEKCSATEECIDEGDWIFVPRLDQLLAEIEKQEYWWELRHHLVDVGGVKKYRVIISKKHNTSIPTKTIDAGTPEDAAAEALCLVLERGRE